MDDYLISKLRLHLKTHDHFKFIKSHLTHWEGKKEEKKMMLLRQIFKNNYKFFG